MQMKAFLFSVLAAVTLMSPFSVLAAGKKKLTPYQMAQEECFGSVDKKVSAQLIADNTDSNMKLYRAVEKLFPLVSSETLYREVLYKQKGELKKLKFEEALLQVFSVDEEENLKLLTSENTGQRSHTYELRYKNISVDSRISQLLNRADIKSDFLKTRETRSKQLTLNINWSEKLIKTMKIDFLNEKKTLECTQKELSDVCTCRPG